jgi:hypothetical protein
MRFVMKAPRLAAVLTLLGLLSLIWTQYWATPTTTSAISEGVGWASVNIPVGGEVGGWVLASGADTRHLTIAANGTLYCYANAQGATSRLFRSTDDGNTWSQTGTVQDVIVDIAAGPDDNLYYATDSIVYKSTDNGNTFVPLVGNPGGAGSNNIVITSIDISRDNTGSIVAAATRDADSAEHGGIYLLDESEPSPAWIDTDAGNYDIACVSFSPDFAADGQLLAVATDETDTFVLARSGDNAWGASTATATIPGVVPLSATIAFPANYAEDATMFLAIATGGEGGDLYMVTRDNDSLVATDLDIGSGYGLDNIDISSVATAGEVDNARILAGATGSAGVYISSDGGQNWATATKQPTGQSETRVLMAPSFSSYGKAYVVTSGVESAFSRTTDFGATWNQVSLIDSTIGAIVDVAVPSTYWTNNTLFMLTFDTQHLKHGLWRSTSGGAIWERVFTSNPSGVDELSLVEVSPQYGTGSKVLFLAGISNGSPAIWKSNDNGQTFITMSAPLPVDAWAVAGDDVLFIGGFDGTDGRVYRFTNGALFPPAGATVGSQPVISVAVSPAYQYDQTILAGNTTGQVYWSDNDGASFQPLGNQLPLVGGIGEVSVAFDPAFGSNRTTYAACAGKVSASSRERIFRFIIGGSGSWQGIDGSLPDGAEISQVAVSEWGTLYAANSQAVGPTGATGGIERSLTPTSPLGQTFETVTSGLVDGTVLNGLWVSQNQLWSIDSQNTRLMSYLDTLSVPTMLLLPANDSTGINPTSTTLSWFPLLGATEYQWQISDDINLSTVPDGFEGKTGASSVRLPILETGTTYYWHVRATRPVLSPWSEIWSFTTLLDDGVNILELLTPEAGASGVPLRPVFQWTAVSGAESYELLVATDIDFTDLLIEKTAANALPTTAWQSDVDLDYETTYYWKVRGLSENSCGTWSAVSAFTTESPPPPPPPEPETETEEEPNPAPPEPETQDPVPVLMLEPVQPEMSPEQPPLSMSQPVETTIPNWAIYVVITLLSVIALLLITILVLAIGKRRL